MFKSIVTTGLKFQARRSSVVAASIMPSSSAAAIMFIPSFSSFSPAFRYTPSASFSTGYFKDRNKPMTRNEVEVLLHAQFGSKLPADAVSIALKEMDVNGDDQVTMDEFLAWAIDMGYQRLSDNADALNARMLAAKLFDQYDTDRCGNIDSKEIQSLYKDLVDNKLYSGTSAEFLAALDDNKDGKIQFVELMNHLMHSEKKA